MEQVIISSHLRLKLDGMVDTLYLLQYFGFRESARKYVQLIYDFIETIPSKPLKPCKNPKYGKYYVRYDNKKSDMKYFVTYDTMDGIYYIEDIISPKTKEYSAVMGQN